MNHNHRSVPCPAHSVAGSFASIGALGLAVAVNAHRDGMARAAEARQTYASNLWHARLIRARSSASEALSVARAAVNRVHDLEAEIADLRLAVASRDSLIRNLSKNA
jgi:hypothetical protein